jgi:hypothetical protein
LFASENASIGSVSKISSYLEQMQRFLQSSALRESSEGPKEQKGTPKGAPFL